MDTKQINNDQPAVKMEDETDDTISIVRFGIDKLDIRSEDDPSAPVAPFKLEDYKLEPEQLDRIFNDQVTEKLTIHQIVGQSSSGAGSDEEDNMYYFEGQDYKKCEQEAFDALVASKAAEDQVNGLKRKEMDQDERNDRLRRAEERRQMQLERERQELKQRWSDHGYESKTISTFREQISASGIDNVPSVDDMFVDDDVAVQDDDSLLFFVTGNVARPRQYKEAPSIIVQ